MDGGQARDGFSFGGLERGNLMVHKEFNIWIKKKQAICSLGCERSFIPCQKTALRL